VPRRYTVLSRSQGILRDTFTKTQFLRGKITFIMDEPTMESILRTLREMYADPDDARDPPSIPEEIERAIRE
jgi:hypothetical protein